MVLGLLTLAAIPTTIGVAEGISSTKKKDSEEEEDPFVTATTEAQRMRKFRLQCYCDARSSKAKEINGGSVVLHDDCLWILPPCSSSSSSSSPFLGFYIPYPDPSRHPPPLGLVSFIPPTPSTPQMLNWIYVALPSRELRYGNRSTSITHTVGPWAWDTGEEDEAGAAVGLKKGDNGGGVTLGGREGCVAVETDEGWKLFWEDGEGKIPSGSAQKKGGRKLQVSIERIFVEDAEEDAGAGAGAGANAKEAKGQDDKGQGKSVRKGTVKGGVEVHDETGEKKEERRSEATLEVKTKTVEAGKGEANGKKREEKTRYEYR
ncbi:MAG: hypothetical protein Q9201_000841 [Fulgogasparrea decipioides]